MNGDGGSVWTNSGPSYTAIYSEQLLRLLLKESRFAPPWPREEFGSWVCRSSHPRPIRHNVSPGWGRAEFCKWGKRGSQQHLDGGHSGFSLFGWGCHRHACHNTAMQRYAPCFAGSSNFVLVQALEKVFCLPARSLTQVSSALQITVNPSKEFTL